MSDVTGLQEVVPSWELQLLASIVVAAVAFGVISLVRRARQRLKDEGNPVVVDLVSSVLVVTIVVATAVVVADIWGQTKTLVEEVGFLRVDEQAPQVVVTLVVLIAIQVFAGITTRLLDDLSTESGALTDHQREVGVRVTQLTLWTTGLVVVLGVWNVDLTGLLVGAGFLGIVIGLASRKTLGSLMAGFVLMFSRPFEVGDWIRIGDEEGIVSDITLMSTRIQAFDGEYVVVPNDIVSNSTVRNRSRQGQFRAEVEVGVDYDTDLERARDAAREAATAVAENHEGALDSPSPDVVVDRFGDSAVVLTVRIWVDQPTMKRVVEARDALVCGVKDAFEADGITIPFPQRELSGREDTGGFRTADAEPLDERGRSEHGRQ